VIVALSNHHLLFASRIYQFSSYQCRWFSLLPLLLLTSQGLATTLCSNLGCNMTTPQQENEHESATNTQPTASHKDGRSITQSTSTLSTSSFSSNQDESFRPYTTLLIVVITNAAQVQHHSSTSSPSQPSQLLSNASITTVATTTSSARTLSTSSKQWHITQVGTVVSGSEIPKAWAPKFLDVEKAKLDIFLGCAALVFVVTIVGIVGSGLVRGRVWSRGRRT
jgi:hypothetical protein